MRTITSAAKELRIGKTKLYSLLAQTGIEPTQQGKSRIIDNAQLQQLQNAIYSCVDPGNDPAGHKKRTTKLSNLDSERSDLHRELVQRMSNEIDHLKDLLTSERTDRQKRENEIATERQNYQQMLMVLQGDMKQLLQQLLEAPTAPAFSVANSAAERDTPAEFTEATPPPETIPKGAGRSPRIRCHDSCSACGAGLDCCNKPRAAIAGRHRKLLAIACP